MSQDELNILDDVSDDQIDSFFEYVEDAPLDAWSFNTATRLLRIDNSQFKTVGDYFRYLRSLHA